MDASAIMSLLSKANNTKSGVVSFLPVIQGLFAHGWKGAKTAWQSLGDATTGAHMTNAQVEATNMEQNFAREQMEFEREMSNTSYQRQVADMQAAGVNPALVMNSGSNGASTPSGASASSQNVGAPDPVGLLAQIANLQLLGSQRKNIDADTDKKRQDIVESSERIKSIRQNVAESLKRVEEMDANIRKYGLESEALEIANRFIQSEKELGLMISGLTASEIDARISEIDGKVALLSAQEKATLQSISESRARIRQYLSQASLNDEQRNEVKALTKKVEQEIENLSKNSTLTDKDIEFYEWNHGSEVSGFGVKPGTRYIPNQKHRDKNR